MVEPLLTRHCPDVPCCSRGGGRLARLLLAVVVVAVVVAGGSPPSERVAPADSLSCTVEACTFTYRSEGGKEYTFDLTPACDDAAGQDFAADDDDQHAYHAQVRATAAAAAAPALARGSVVVPWSPGGASALSRQWPGGLFPARWLCCLFFAKSHRLELSARGAAAS